jgi:hypothetical protein
VATNITPSFTCMTERIGPDAQLPEPSSELLALTRLLATVEEGTQASAAMLRRPVSTAYYALFHKTSHAAAQRFMGRDQEASAGYALIYRSFDHRHMKTVCLALQASTLKERFRNHLRRNAVSQDMRDFAEVFPGLQEGRHLVDYDPSVAFLAHEVSAQIDSAIAAFDRVDPTELTDVLALMMVRARG